MTAPAADVDDAAEIYDPRIPRVDAVAGPAHGIPFHIIKAGDGRLTKEQRRMADDLADTVDDAHKRADTDPAAAGDSIDPEKDPAAQTPGSPAWEAIDAAKAREGLVGLTAVRQLVRCLADREDTETRNGGDGDDAENVGDLDAADDALEFAIGILAKYAVTEQAEADQGLAEIEAEAEALGLRKALEARGAVLKAGRVLSQQNQQALEQAQAILASILGQLEKAPQAAEGGEPVKVAKAADLSSMPGPLLQLLEQFLTAAQAWQSTQGDDLAGVDDGTEATPTDPAADLGADPATDPAAGPTDGTEAAPVADDTTTDPAPAPVQAAAAAPTTPADPAAVPAPADPVTPAPAPAAGDDTTVQKAQSGQVGDDLLERLTKSLTGAVEAAVKPLEERIAKMESTPMPGGPMLAGQLPGVIADMTGRHAQPAPVDTPVARIEKALGEIADPHTRAAAQSTAFESVLRAKLFPGR